MGKCLQERALLFGSDENSIREPQLGFYPLDKGGPMLYHNMWKEGKVEQGVDELLRAALAAQAGKKAPRLTIFSLPSRSRAREAQALQAVFSRIGPGWEIFLPRVGRVKERLICCDSVQFLPLFPTGVVAVGIKKGKAVFWGRYGAEPHVYTF